MIHSRLKRCTDSNFCRKQQRSELFYLHLICPESPHIWTASAPFFSLAKAVFTHSLKIWVFQLFYDSSSDPFLLNGEKPQGSWFSDPCKYALKSHDGFRKEGQCTKLECEPFYREDNKFVVFNYVFFFTLRTVTFVPPWPGTNLSWALKHTKSFSGDMGPFSEVTQQWNEAHLRVKCQTQSTTSALS